MDLQTDVRIWSLWSVKKQTVVREESLHGCRVFLISVFSETEVGSPVSTEPVSPIE